MRGTRVDVSLKTKSFLTFSFIRDFPPVQMNLLLLSIHPFKAPSRGQAFAQVAQNLFYRQCSLHHHPALLANFFTNYKTQLKVSLFWVSLSYYLFRINYSLLWLPTAVFFFRIFIMTHNTALPPFTCRSSQHATAYSRLLSTFVTSVISTFCGLE